MTKEPTTAKLSRWTVDDNVINLLHEGGISSVADNKIFTIVYDTAIHRDIFISDQFIVSVMSAGCESPDISRFIWNVFLRAFGLEQV